MRRKIAGLLCAASSFALLNREVVARDLTREERIGAQEAIERVYWERRIWPRENRAPKPALRDVLPPEQIEARALDVLRKSQALATLFARPITADDLQAEMRRMAASTRDPDLLRDLFAALGNDPFRIAETLARQTLADRWIREAYDRGAPDRGTEASPSDFEAWWARTSPSVGADVLPSAGSYDAVVIPATADCVPDSWRPIPPAPVPSIGRQAVWTGTEMIVWGMYTPGEPARGARYNPATDTWITMTSLGAPASRWGHSAVWTGREMIVWGGVSSGNVEINSGGRYDPTLNLWRPMSTMGAPLPRAEHTAVWTGGEMIVWGGKETPIPAAILYKDGGRYNPETDSWSPVGLTGAPTERASHVAVWTGSQMIVWGGYSAHALPRDGGRYNPADDTWTPTSTGGMPFPRHNVKGVWTGSEMIVWGGGLTTGGRYDPVRDVWTPTSMQGFPDVPDGHVAIWTGHEMIVWGGSWYQGEGGPVMSVDGGRYNPGHDTWVPMSLQGAPSVPFASTVVWTGREMLIWMEYAGTSNGSSARYCASTCDDDATRYADSDGDGYGNPAAPLDFCAPAGGFVANALDCNDTNAGIRPGAVEVCNGIDDNCTGFADDGPLDRDGDHVADACDTCPDLAGAPQTDTDHDGRGDACDPCPLHPLNDRDGDGVCEGTDNCPDTANAGQEDSNNDGAGDACQPAVRLSRIRATGNHLTATVSAVDPDGDALRGDVAIMRREPNDVVLQDLGDTYDCGMGFYPEGILSKGIGYAWGSVGEPVLFDLDASVGCDDGVQDYALGLGACDAPGTVLSNLLPLTGVPLPAVGCLREVGAQHGGRAMMVHEITPDSARLSFPDLVAIQQDPYEGRIPRRVPLPVLTVGATYTLRVTATDGLTPPVAATTEFVYRGEKDILLNPAPRGSLTTPTRPPGIGIVPVGVVSP